MIENLISKENKKIKQIKALDTKKNREKLGCFLVEGKRMVSEAVEYVPDRISYIVISETFHLENNNWVKGIDEMGISVYTIKDNVFRSVSNTVNPQGIAAVIKIKDVEKPKSEYMKRVLILDGVSEPGNVGTIIRTAEAAGIDAIYLMKGCADVLNPKVVRSTMGSLFRVPIIQGCSIEDLKELKNNGFEIIVSSLDDSVNINEYNTTKKPAIVIGSEASGVHADVLAISDVKVHIPMQGRVESLNAAVAAGILMYRIG